MPPSITQTASSHTGSRNWGPWLQVVGLVYLLLVAVALIGSGFKVAAGDQAKELFAFASNPITGVIVGTIATALIQSSSTVTSIIVGLVAGGLPVSIAIPLIMGANMGTTITNTIVSLGHVRQGEEFRRAFAAATVHDFFNLFSILIFLPLEIMFGFLEKIGVYLSSLMVGGESMAMGGFNFINPIVKPPVNLLKDIFHGLGAGDMFMGIVFIILGIAMILVVITAIGKLLKVLMVGRAKAILHTAVGRGPVSGIVSGTAITVLVQSSSTTTSLVVPLAGSGVFSLRQIYPFTLGANIGTCITALLAATAVDGANAVFALQIALVHIAYNVIGVIVIYGLPFTRNIPIYAAEWLAGLAMKSTLYVAAYIGLVFFVIPVVMIGLSQMMGW